MAMLARHSIHLCRLLLQLADGNAGAMDASLKTLSFILHATVLLRFSSATYMYQSVTAIWA